MRRVMAVVLAGAVQAYATTAPFIHAHVDDHDTDHHAGPAVHAHLAPHLKHHESAGLPEIGDDDHDRPVYLQLFVAVGTPLAALTAIHVVTFALPAPAEARAHLPVQTVHGLDPPLVRLLPSRAPPASLS
jgi:hypothetical protein